MSNDSPSSKPTEGPWKVLAEAWLHDGAPTICTATGGGMILATVTHRDGNVEGQLGDPLADALLMAAAPELLRRRTRPTAFSAPCCHTSRRGRRRTTTQG